jgi:PhnB protein
MLIQPYLFFEGRCDEAIEFYKAALDAKVLMVMRYKESPQSPPSGFPPEILDKVMHSSLRIGDTTISLSDGHCQAKPSFSGVSLTLSVSSDAEADRYFAALSDGGKVGMPLGKTFFSSRFGMVTDQFGVLWMVIVQG